MLIAFILFCFFIGLIISACSKKDASKSGGEHINSVSKNDAKNSVGGVSSFSSRFVDIYLYAGINNIEGMIKSHMTRPTRCFLNHGENGLYIETTIMNENVYYGINNEDVVKVHYIGGAQAEKDTGKAVAGAITLGVVGLLAGMVNEDRLLIAIEKTDGKLIVFGIENYYKPDADKFFANCFGEKFDPTLKFEEDNAQVINGSSNADELMKYKQLLDSGAITQDEYDAKKKQLLNL